MKHTRLFRETARVVAVAVLAALAFMLFGGASALAAPQAPDDATSHTAVPLTPGPGDLIPVPPGCKNDAGEPVPCPPPPPVDPCKEHPDSERCVPERTDPCKKDPRAQGCRPPDREIPTPTRIDTGAGGTASDGHGVALLVVGIGTLAMAAGLARRHVVSGEHR